MSEIQLKGATNEKIVETQKESEEDDEITFSLLVDGQIVSWAKTLLYSSLEEIRTVRKERRKGFGRKLLAYLEKNAKACGATTMKTNDINHCNDEAISFFVSIGYEVKPIMNEAAGFLQGTKKL
jgi:ribosomal protein S18 acetylase RimI-like enzyme